MIKAVTRLFLVSLIVVTPLVFANSPISPFTAEYNILRKGDKVGEGVRTLEKTQENQYKYQYKTDIEWLIFSDTRTESSLVNISDKGQVTPLHYEFKRTGTGSDKKYAWDFMPEQNIGKHSDGLSTAELDFSEPLQDKLSYHLQQRLQLISNPKQRDFVFTVIQKSGRTKSYVYQYAGEEELMLPYGTVKAIKLKREVLKDKKVTYAWFAPELDYLLVRLHQQEGGVEQFEVQLNNYTKS